MTIRESHRLLWWRAFAFRGHGEPRRLTMMKGVNILTLKWGTKYGPEYANRLFAGVDRNLGLDFRFLCFTDDPKGTPTGDRGASDSRLRRTFRLATDSVAQARALSGRLGRTRRSKPVPRSRYRDYGAPGRLLYVCTGPTVHHPRLGKAVATDVPPTRGNPAIPRSSVSSPEYRAPSSTASWPSGIRLSRNTARWWTNATSPRHSGRTRSGGRPNGW